MESDRVTVSTVAGTQSRPRLLDVSRRLPGSVEIAGLGGAVFTPLMGLVFEVTSSMAEAMLVPLACYVFIGYFSFIGSRVRVRGGQLA